MAGGEPKLRTRRKGFIYTHAVCACSRWEYIFSLVTGWTSGHGPAAASPLGLSDPINIFSPTCTAKSFSFSTGKCNFRTENKSQSTLKCLTKTAGEIL